jgi:hypothetical protein
MALITEKTDLDNILSKDTNINNAIGNPVLNPTQYTVLDLLKQIENNTSGGGSNVFDGALFTAFPTPVVLNDHDTYFLHIGSIIVGDSSYLGTYVDRITVPKTGIYRVIGQIIVNATTVNEQSFSLYINNTAGIGQRYNNNVIGYSSIEINECMNLNANDFFNFDISNYNGTTNLNLNDMSIQYLGTV